MADTLALFEKISYKEAKKNKLICNTCNNAITNLTDSLNYCFLCDKFLYTNSSTDKIVAYNVAVSQFENKVIHLTTIINSIFKDKNVMDKIQEIKKELENRNVSIDDVTLDDIYRIIKIKNLKSYNSATEIYMCLKTNQTNNKYISNDIIRVIECLFIKLFQFVYEYKKTNYTINYSFFLEKILNLIGVDIGFTPKILKNNRKNIENTHIWDAFVNSIQTNED